MDKRLNIYSDRLKSCGIPDINVDINVTSKTLGKDNWNIASKFVHGLVNVVLYGKDSYLYAVKLMRLRMIHNLTISAKMIPYSYFLNNDYYFVNQIYDSVSIVEIVADDNVKKYDLVNKFVSNLLMNDSKILLVGDSFEAIHTVFKNTWNNIDLNFEPIIIKG